MCYKITTKNQKQDPSVNDKKSSSLDTSTRPRQYKMTEDDFLAQSDISNLLHQLNS
jgi:hypothetical protein